MKAKSSAQRHSVEMDGVNLTLKELISYKQQSLRWLPPAKSLWSQMLGQHQSSALGRGMDFAEVRQYQPGDDIRSIDWRVTARTGKTHTKLYTEEREKPVMLYIDLSESMRFGSTFMLKSVLASHMAALVSWLSTANNDRVGAVIDLGTQLIDVKPSARNSGPLKVIQQLVNEHSKLLQKELLQNGSTKNDVNTDNLNSMTDGLTALNRLCPKGSEIIIISDFSRFNAHSSETHNTQTEQEILLTRLSRHNRIRLVHVGDPLESGHTQFRGVERVSNRNQTQWFDFSSSKNRKKLKIKFDRHQASLEKRCRQLGMSYHYLSTDQALVDQVTG
ncbi:DUF58 domain-containing protein [Vibrio mexicanus]|uniref:DUF58 domain-containing protein n=1 Tax=Vibrio mexicanus TaxID=1004326 RepID=UPI00063C15B6|nr:DUF58 domain-containing protein [Vibrio mexicanus]